MPNYFYAPYLPRSGGDRLNWLANFSMALPSYSTKFNITTTELGNARADFEALNYARVTLLNYTRTFSKAVTAYADELDTDPSPNTSEPPIFSAPMAPASVETAVFKRLDDLIQAKILPLANDTDKMALQLNPISVPSTVTAKITDVEALARGQVALVFRRGAAKLVFIYSRRGTETELTLLDKVADTHFLDVRANLVAGQSEAREYQIEWSLDGRNGDGNLSPLESVATKA